MCASRHNDGKHHIIATRSGAHHYERSEYIIFAPANKKRGQGKSRPLGIEYQIDRGRTPKSRHRRVYHQGAALYIIKSEVAASCLVKYSAYAECEIISCGNCEISPVACGSIRCEMKFALHICEANISQRSYFTWRSHISLAEGEFR